ncbi:MAG: sulfur oxidation c-type cytochrome SoxX [Methylobacteriaceae bacterium]|nr:sulfur oxidation c-type cytochrome SoxX [Methylobacteriaceae bacterium]
MKIIKLLAAAALSFAVSPALAQDKAAPVDRAVFDKLLTDAFAKAPEDWRKKMQLDETQRICTETRNQPSNAQVGAIIERESKDVKYPADGKFFGDIKAGLRVANTGTGAQFSDQPTTYVGGNCYACHQMDVKEVSYGTLGPSLMGYGKARQDEASIKEAWKKIYNSQAVVPCSNMPRFGAKAILTEQQMKDVMAYLLSPDSPVNK